jgi:hypothetical protein
MKRLLPPANRILARDGSTPARPTCVHPTLMRRNRDELECQLCHHIWHEVFIDEVGVWKDDTLPVTQDVIDSWSWLHDR